MTMLSHEPANVARERRSWSLKLLVPEMWACLAIVVMWLAVLFVGVFGPDIVDTSAGGNMSRIPSGAAVALFAFLATWMVAKYGFRRRD